MSSKNDDKKDANDLRGFQEFLESQKDDGRFLPKPQPSASKKLESNFTNLTFLTNDRSRLMRTKALLNEKVNFMAKFDQSETLLYQQASEIDDLRGRIFEHSDEAGSPYRKSLREIFDGFFNHTS